MKDKYCVHCGKPLDGDSNYCIYCGKIVARRRTSQKRQKSGLSIPKMLLLFILIFALCAGTVFHLMTRDTGLVKRNVPTPTPLQMYASVTPSPIPEPELTEEPTEAPTAAPTEQPTQKPTSEPTKAPKINASYKNNRYAFSLSYPEKVFTSSGSSSNGDGIVLYGDNITVSAYGSNNVFHKDLNESYESTLKSYPDATYHVKKSNFYVISGINGDNIYYVKEYVGSESINTMIIEYPKSKKKEFDAVVTTVANSFKPGDLSKSY